MLNSCLSWLFDRRMYFAQISFFKLKCLFYQLDIQRTCANILHALGIQVVSIGNTPDAELNI